jgi:DUF4097 and DUF4098 domain-containing protein YvlB
MYTFSTPAPVRLRVELWQGRLSVEAADTDTTTVELRPLHGGSAAEDLIDQAKVEQRGDEIVVQMPKAKGGLFRSRAEIAVDIRVPAHSSAKVELASADVDTRGPLGNVQIISGSGDISVESAADIDVKSGSGDVAIETASGSCDVKCGSADVSIGSVGHSADIMAGSGDVAIESVAAALKVKTGSGDVMVRSAGDSVDAMAGSGDLMLRRIDRGKIKVKTGTGDISIGVARGTAAYLDIMTVTGDVRSDLDPSESPDGQELTAEINIQSGSGDVVLQRA